MPPINGSSVIPYEVAFVLLMILVAVLKGEKLARASRILIVLYIPFALALSIYTLGFKRNIWQEASANGETLDVVRYSRATQRSSAVYVVLNILLLVGAKILGVSYNSVNYNYIALFVTTMITFLYDRAIATDDGLMHFKQSPARTILDAYLTFCSPSFMRYLIVLACEIPLMILIAYFIGSLIPSHCWVASALFRKSIVPVIVFAIVGGPLRFAWAYPTVSEAGRIPYLLAYTIAFIILAIVTYASGRIEPRSTAFVLILIALVAIILQMGSMSNAPREPDVYDDARVMPMWLMIIFATAILVSVLIIAYRIFVDFLQPFLMTTRDQTDRALAKQMANRSKERHRRIGGTRL